VDATNDQAINRIFEIKGRNFNNPISVIIGNAQDVYPLVRNVSDSARKLMDAFWPGPLTIIFEASDRISPLLTANTGKIGIRLSSNDIARGIAQKTGKPLTATSANLSGSPECEDADQVLEQIGNQIEAIVDTGKTESRIGSTILDASCEPVQIIRPGVIASEVLQNCVILK
jgi:L-threonylcarbamoyladenylate synthase